MNKEVKRSLIAIIAVALVGIGGTWAYFTHMQSLRNVFSVGTNTITITEEFEPPKEMETGENVFKKKVQVENTGTVPCFVRVFVDFSDSSVTDMSQISPDGSAYYPAAEYTEHLPDGWVYISEEENGSLGGYYYYTEMIDPGKKTIPLFEKVKTHFDTEEQIVDYDIIVYSESVQVLDMEGSDFSGSNAYKDAWTEFMERR